MAMYQLTTGTFDHKVLESEAPILVEFSAPWCGFCRRLAPVLDRMKDQPGMPDIGTINIDDDPFLAQRFSVDTIPTLLLFQKGSHGEPLVAPATAAQIKDWMASQGV